MIENLKENYRQKKFILWGRSMGAVAALLYLAVKSLPIDIKGEMGRELSVIGGIYDSPFHSLYNIVDKDFEVKAGHSTAKYDKINEYLTLQIENTDITDIYLSKENKFTFLKIQINQCHLPRIISPYDFQIEKLMIIIDDVRCSFYEGNLKILNQYENKVKYLIIPHQFQCENY